MRRLLSALGLLLCAALPAWAQSSSINTTLPANGQPYSASVVRGNFVDASNDLNRLFSLNVGTSAPFTCNLAAIGNPWLNTSTTPYTLSYCDGAGTWVAQDFWDVTNHIVTPPTGRGVCQTITAATTTDLGSVPQSCLTVSGNSSVSITSLGSSAKAGDIKIVSFNGANTLVYNAVSLILPGAANQATVSGTVCIFEALGSGNWAATGCAGPGAGGTSVTSFNGRTGAVLPATNDYTFGQIGGTIGYNQLVTPLQSGTTNYIVYWSSNSTLANGSPALIASQVLPAISPPGVSINVSGTLGSPATSVTIQADGFVVCSALTSANCTELGSYNQTFNGGTVGAGGMDTGTLPSNGTIALYAIYNPIAPSTSILGCSTAISGCGNTIYSVSPSHMPSGYTQSALLGRWAINSTPALVAGTATSVAPFSVTTAAAILTTVTPQGRLSLTSATPVMTATVSGATTIYYTPYIGAQVPVFDGTNWSTLTCPELTNITTNSATGNAGPAAVTTSSNYDLFVWNNAGTCTLTRSAVWTNNTTRANTLVYQNGILLNNASITNGPGASRGTFVGTVHSNGSSQIDYIFGASASGGTACSFEVWNEYNRVSTVCAVLDSGTPYTYTSATVREARGSTGNQGSFVLGLQEDGIIASVALQNTANGASNAIASSGIGLDITNGYSCQPWITEAVGTTSIVSGGTNTCGLRPSIGNHTIAATEGGDGTNANTFDGSSVNQLSFIVRN